MSTGIEIVFDTESDGFRDEATVLWCIVALDINSKNSQSCGYHVGNASPDLHHRYLLDYLDTADHLIGHNIIDHDFPLMERLYGWRPRPGVKITDTLTKSRLLRSDRPLPPGCPGNLTPTHWVLGVIGLVGVSLITVIGLSFLLRCCTGAVKILRSMR